MGIPMGTESTRLVNTTSSKYQCAKQCSGRRIEKKQHLASRVPDAEEKEIPTRKTVNFNQSINQSSINHQSINDQSINHQSINQSINHQSINQSIKMIGPAPRARARTQGPKAQGPRARYGAPGPLAQGPSWGPGPPRLGPLGPGPGPGRGPNHLD